MKPFMITTPKGMNNLTRAGVSKNSKSQVTADCAWMQLSINTNKTDMKIITGDDGSIEVIVTKKVA